MKKDKKSVIILIVTVVLFILLLAGGSIGYKILSKQMEEEQKQEEIATENVGSTENTESTENTYEQADDFLVYNKNGDEVRLSGFKGEKPVVVNFWASWCPPCKAEMPYFEKAIEEYGDQVEFLMVNVTDGMRETVEKADEFIKEAGYTMDIVYDSDLDASSTYFVQSIPRTLFVNKNGELVFDQVGMISEELLKTNIEKIIEK